jgi:cellulose synthase/poly-beta-1,6-N-acetylglucosamine synthase-like glycosyltransferase
MTPQGFALEGAAIALLAAGLAVVVRGGRGDRGDGRRHVVLAPPRRSAWRVALFFGLVLAWSIVVAIDYVEFSAITKGILGSLESAAGMGAELVASYLAHTNPLVALLVDGSLAALVVARRHTRRSLAASLAALAVIVAGEVALVAAVEVGLGLVAAPAELVFYLAELASLAGGFLGLLALTFLTTELPRRYGARSGVRPIGGTLLLLGLVLMVLVATGALLRGVGASLSIVSPPDGVLIFLTLPSLIMGISVLLLLTRSKDRPGRGDPAEPIDVIMPAYNEEAGIGDALAALDRAAARYRGHVRVLVADDGSEDRTCEVVAAAGRQARAAEILLVDGPHGGKSFALNRALEAACTRIVVRVDADIIVDERCFTPLPHWFANPGIGCIGAFDLPNFSLPAWYTWGRLFECLMTFGFSRLAYERLDANNVPGTFMAFRRAEALGLGGFVEGMNGEDSDLTFNLGKLGLRSVIDPRVVIYEDVPQRLSAFVEQRTRWSRASFHVAARHLPWSAGEMSPRMLIQARFLLNKLTSMIRPITYVSSALFFLLIPRALGSPLRTLVLLALTLLPQLLLLVATALYWGFWRELRHLWVWVPFTIARKIGLISGILSLPPVGEPSGVERPSRREVVADVAPS